ncbi:MAG: M15 family metallopeptidase [Clostridia bacterium]|nr:M15 family metallopeptidase [Clostridia bacterium]
MARYNKKKSSGSLGAVALIVLAAMVLSSVIGVAMGNTETGKTPVPSGTPSNTVDPSGTPSGNNGETVPQNGADPEPAKEPTAKEKALSRQDFTIDPATGMAKEIKIVDDNYTILVNRTHPLAQSYKPDDMVTVKYVVSGVGKKGETDQLRKVAAEAFEAMVEAAAEQEIKIKMRTGFRSYEYQKDRLYDPEVKNKGQAEADKATARPGHSEHQTGLALDVGGESQKYALSYEFGETKEGKWVAEHCHEFGFIIRYVDGTKKEPGKLTGYVFEPWHIRYVGVDVATEMYELGGGKLTYEEYLGILD